MSEEKSQPTSALTSRQKQFLKGLAHSLRPLVQIGKEGMTPRIFETIGNELKNHELIKVKIGNNSGLEKHNTCKMVVEQTACEIVQLIGKTIVLYKRNPKRSKDKRINLPKTS